MFPFLYKVECFKCSCEEITREVAIQAGIIYAKNYVSAVEVLVQYYDEDDIIEILSLFPMEDSPIIITGEAYDAIKKGDWDVDTYIK